MMRARRSRPQIFLLMALNALLLSLIAYEVVSLQPKEGEAAGAVLSPAQSPVARQQPKITRTLDAYGELVNRPLFNKERRPLEREEPANSEEDALAFTLRGVVITPAQQVAIIYSRSQQQPVKVPLWGWIEGWRLVSVQAGVAHLRKGSRSLELPLQRTSQGGAKQ